MTTRPAVSFTPGAVESAAMTDRDLPPLLAIGDELDRIERKADADADIADDIDAVRGLLDEYENREGRGRTSLLDDIDNVLLRMGEPLSGDADRQAEAIQNRLHQFRDSLTDRSESLSLTEPRLQHDGVDIDVTERGGQQVDVVAKLVNAGEATDGVVRVGFYDRDGTVRRHIDLFESAVEAGEKRDVSATVTVPENVTHYDIAAVDADID